MNEMKLLTSIIKSSVNREFKTRKKSLKPLNKRKKITKITKNKKHSLNKRTKQNRIL